MLIGKKDNKDAETFWNEKEKELGTEVLGKTLGRVIVENNTAPLWGLFYTTCNAVYFQTFKSDNWISTLFSGSRGTGRTKDETITISRESLITFAVQERKRGLLKLLRQPPMVEISWKDEETGNMHKMLFEMEGNAHDFVETFPAE